MREMILHAAQLVNMALYNNYYSLDQGLMQQLAFIFNSYSGLT